MTETAMLLQEAIKIYVPEDFDWMLYSITNTNRLTMHHIIPQEEEGPTTLSNLALITHNAHCRLNRLHHHNLVVYKEWNILFRQINDSMAHPSREHIEKALELRRYSGTKYYGKGITFK